MDAIKSLLEFISDKEMSVPLGQVILFVVLNSVSILMGRYRMGLLISYCFVIYWGFVANNEYFVDMLGNTHWGLTVYIFSGVIMLILFILGFFRENKG